jgi:hypothetical protein
MKVRPKLRRTARFRRYELVSVCGNLAMEAPFLPPVSAGLFWCLVLHEPLTRLASQRRCSPACPRKRTSGLRVNESTRLGLAPHASDRGGLIGFRREGRIDLGLGLGGAALSRVRRGNVLVRQSFDHNKFQIERFLSRPEQGRFRIVATVELASETPNQVRLSGACWAARPGGRPLSWRSQPLSHTYAICLPFAAKITPRGPPVGTDRGDLRILEVKQQSRRIGPSGSNACTLTDVKKLNAHGLVSNPASYTHYDGAKVPIRCDWPDHGSAPLCTLANAQ